MAERKVALLGDLHLGARGGDEFMMKFQIAWLEKFIAQLKEARIDTVIQAGDFFDVRKNMSVLLMFHVIHTIVPMFRKAGLKVIVIDGNHDIFYRDSNTVDSLCLLEALAPDVFTIVRENREMEILGESFFLMGWINKSNMEEQVRAASTSKAKYCVGHLALTGFAMYKGIKSEEGMSLEPFKNFQKVYTGHYHTISDHQNVQYIGAPYHLNWADYPDGRNRGWFELNLEEESDCLYINDEDDTLFRVMTYDATTEYDAAFMKPYVGKFVKIIVNEVPDNRKYKKFLSLLTETDMIDYKIIDNTIMVATEGQIVVSVEELSTDTPTVISGYLEKLGTEGIITDVEGVKTLALDIFTRASNIK